MAELPTPHSIVVCTLITLYSGPGSPLFPSGENDDGLSSSPSSFSAAAGRLSAMIQRLVLTEDEGVVVVVAAANNYERRDCYREFDEPADEALGVAAADSRSTGVERRRLENFDDDDDVVIGTSLCVESLSSLMDRIDRAVTAPEYEGGCEKVTRKRRRRWERSSASLALLRDLETSVSSVDALSDLFDDLRAATSSCPEGAGEGGLTEVAVDGDSSHGAYLRRYCLGFDDLPFEAVARLWTALCAYVREGTESCRFPDDGDGGDHHDSYNDDNCVDAWGTAKASGGYTYGETDTDDDVDMEDDDDALLTDRGGPGRRGCDRDGGTVTELSRAKATAVLPAVPGAPWLPSHDQIERAVRRTCLHPRLEDLLRTDASSRDTVGGGGATLEDVAWTLLSTHPECPSVHFLRFLSCLSRGERAGALDSLHRYFDYAMIHERKERATLAMAAAMGGGGSGGMDGPDGGGVGSDGHRGRDDPRGGGGASGATDRNVMQYAAILLAQTHHRFGYYHLSLRATEEAVRVAQQSGDDACVSFALGWLALASEGVEGRGGKGWRGFEGIPPAAFASDRRRGGDDEDDGGKALLRRCRDRASERGLPSLAAGASLELARREAHRSRGDAWEAILCVGREVPNAAGRGVGARGMMIGGNRGGHRGNLGGMGAGGIVGGTAASSAAVRGGGRMGGDSSSSPTDVDRGTSEALRALGRRSLAFAGLWDSAGRASRASLSASVALRGGCGADLTPGEVSTASLRVAASAAHGAGSDIRSLVSGNSTAVPDGSISSSSVEQLLLGTFDEADGLCKPAAVSTCVYGTTLNELVDVSPPRSPTLISNCALVRSAANALHEWSAFRRDLALARSVERLLGNHAALPSGGGGVHDAEAFVTHLGRITHRCIAERRWDGAESAARAVCSIARRWNWSQLRGWNLVQLAQIEIESSRMRRPDRALTYLLECLALCEERSLDPLHAVALSTLARVHLGMGQYARARSMIRATMPSLMQDGHAWFRGEACMTLAKCHLAEANQLEGAVGETTRTDDARVVHLRRTASSQLDESVSFFRRIQDVARSREVHYLQARVCNLLSNGRRKRDAAVRFFEKDSAKMMSGVVNPSWHDAIKSVTDSSELRRIAIRRD